MKNIVFILLASGLFQMNSSLCQENAALTKEQAGYLTKTSRHEKSGWIYIHIEGPAYERGFQYGFTMAAEIADGIATTAVNWEHLSALPWSWLSERAEALFADKIDPENRFELEGIRDGLRAAGHPIHTGELIAYNAWFELSSYWWPEELKKMDVRKVPQARESCSAFIATGDMTADGNIVMGHNSMSYYHEALPNVIIDIRPETGHRILMQTWAGWIHSGTDFFVTDAGLVGCETTIGGFSGFDTTGIPEFSRMRRATQDADSIGEWCAIMKKGNNGGYANAWLLGDIQTGEIARLELGLKFTSLERTRNGYYTGSNIAENLQILRFETDADETDIRNMSISRKVRWKQLMDKYAGKIDLELAQQFEADHTDTYLSTVRYGGRGLCCHAELENESCGWPTSPYYPAGTLDGKAIDAGQAKKMSFTARWGNACGLPFHADAFLSDHPQYEWMRGILKDRPTQPWVVFRAGE